MDKSATKILLLLALGLFVEPIRSQSVRCGTTLAVLALHADSTAKISPAVGDKDAPANRPLANNDIVFAATNHLLKYLQPGKSVEGLFSEAVTAVREGRDSATLEELRQGYLAFRNYISPDLAAEAAGLYYVRTGVRLDAELKVPLPRGLSLEHPGVSFLLKHGYGLSHANRLFDARSTLSALKSHVLAKEAEFNTKFPPEQAKAELTKYLTKFLGDFEGFWANHGEGHTNEISYIGFQALDQLQKQGAITPAQLAVLTTGHALMAKTHDMGMADPSKPGNRDNHWKVSGKLAFGATIPGYEIQKQLLDKTITEIAKDKSDPLVQMLYKVAATKYISSRYKGSQEQIVQTLLREYMLGTYSHGHEAGKYSVDLGLPHLASRRTAYLGELKRPLEGTVQETLNLAELYQSEDGFMAWAKSGVPGAEAKEAALLNDLQRLFAVNESLLNSADADRSKGKGGGVSGAGQAQPFLVSTSGGPEGRIVIADARDGVGDKIILSTGARQARSLQVGSVNDLGVDSADGRMHFSVEVLPTFQSGEAFGNNTGGATGSVVGNKTRANRALLLDLGKTGAESVPVVTVKIPFVKAESAEFTKGVKKGVFKELATSFVRNGRFSKEAYGDRTDLTGDQKKEMMADWLSKQPDIVRFEYAPAAEKRTFPVAKNLAELNKLFESGKSLRDVTLAKYVTAFVNAGAPPREKSYVGRDGATHTYKPENLFEGARIVKVPPGTELIKAGDEPDFTYVVLKGTLKGRPIATTGNSDFLIKQDIFVNRLSIVGATSYLAAEAVKVPSGSTELRLTTPRNATVTAPADGEAVIVLMIPQSTMLKYWDPMALTVTPEELPETLQRMSLQGRSTAR